MEDIEALFAEAKLPLNKPFQPTSIIAGLSLARVVAPAAESAR